MKVQISKYPKNPVKERKVSVNIEDHDVWSLDHTLALIIHPALVLLKSKKHGSPLVADEDVPDELKSTAVPPVDKYDVDENYHKRWDWVLDEMIFAFDEIIHEHALDLFSTGEHDILWIPLDAQGNKIEDEKKAELFEMAKGPNDTHVFDHKGYEAFCNRVKNGTRLFGIYYQNLWD